MRRIIFFLAIFGGALAHAQATFTLSGVAGEPSLSVTVSATAVSNLTAWVASAPANSLWPNSAGAVPTNTTLSSDITSTGSTSISLASAENLATCNGLLVDSEVMAVVSKSGKTVTVLRGTTGSAVAIHSAGAAVTVLRSGNYTCQLKAFWADAISQVVNAKLQGALLTIQTSAIAAAQAQIATQVAGAVQ